MSEQEKQFLEYDELVGLLVSRGMNVNDPLRAQRKLTQVGYYRFKGYSYPARYFEIVNIDGRNIKRVTTNYRHGTSFEDAFNFYLMDKRMRILLLDAIERIEVYFRAIIAHEIGGASPTAYLDKKNFSKEAFKDAGYGTCPNYSEWLDRHNRLLAGSKEESILNHIKNGKPIPLWVASEAWDFGCLSKFYSMLTGANQDLICSRVGVNSRRALDNWLININGIRNRCAHHSRICNRANPRDLIEDRNGYFNLLSLDAKAKNRIYGIISVIWFLLKKIGPSSEWIKRVADLFDSKPNLPGLNYVSMGFPENGFPRDKFPELRLVNQDVEVPHDDPKNVDEYECILRFVDEITDEGFSIHNIEWCEEKSQKLGVIKESILDICVELDGVDK